MATVFSASCSGFSMHFMLGFVLQLSLFQSCELLVILLHLSSSSLFNLKTHSGDGLQGATNPADYSPKIQLSGHSGGGESVEGLSLSWQSKHRVMPR